MRKTNKKYTNGEITVIWKPDACAHSRLCWTQLNEVFKPKERPWVQMDGAATDRIIEQVNKCPSGALSFVYNEEQEAGESRVDAESIVEVTPNGPLLIYGNLTVRHPDGREEKKFKTTALCRCGGSANKPYCDGTHRKNGFEG